LNNTSSPLSPEMHDRIAVLNRYYTVSEVGKLTGIPESTIYDLARQKRIVGMVRIGRHIRFDKVKIDAWLDAGGELSSS
jgi:excisionase family DNA binding protein